MRHFLLFLFSLIVLNGMSQSVRLYGKVVDSSDAGIPGATAMLIGQEDSILKSFSITNKEGNFILDNVKPDDYLVKVNFFGFEPYEIPLSIGSGAKDSTLGVITLSPKMLNQVTVTSSYIPIQIKGDTIEYDSRAFETGEHDVVENLLEQLPGVEVQPDGTIKVQGKTVEKILVDGEEFFGNDPTIATKNLPADAVDKVQVFEKDSEMATFTGVKDGDESTTINLTLKEDRKKGYFGNISGAYGGRDEVFSEGTLMAPDRYQLKGNVHSFKNKFQFSLIGLTNNVNETGFSLNDYISFMGGIQNLMNGSGSINFDMDDGLPIANGAANGFLSTHATGMNLSYRPSDDATLTSSVFFNAFDKTFDRSIERTTFFEDSSIFSDEVFRQANRNYNSRANVHYKQTFDTTHFMNLDLTGQWTSGNSNNSNLLRNLDQNQNPRNQFNTNLFSDRLSYNGAFKGDYRKKYGKIGRYTGGGIELGIEQQNTLNRLSFDRTFFENLPVTESTLQQQDETFLTRNIGGNWMFSEALSKRHLIQFSTAYRFQTDERQKRVDDIADGETTFNPLFSGEGAYQTQDGELQIQHKYLTKKWKTTTGVSGKQIDLHAPEMGISHDRYAYLLPFFRVNLRTKNSGDFMFDYATNINLPQLRQLQSIPDNSNPSEIILGNPSLLPTYQHTAFLQYNIFNEFNFTNFMLRLTGQRTENKINYSQFIDENLNRVFLPENNGAENRIGSYISFGTNLKPLKTKFSITSDVSLSNGQVKINEVNNGYSSFYSETNLTVENIKKKTLSLRTGVGFTYSENNYANNELLNNSFISWNYWASFRYRVKDKWVFNADANQYLYPTFENNTRQLIVNASIARNFLKSRKLQVFVEANDLLNQNTGINQAYYLNYFEQERSATLARYVMVGLKYSFRKIGQK